MGLVFELLFSGTVLGFGLYQLWSVRRDMRRADEDKAHRPKEPG